MKLAEQKIISALESCQRALENLYKGNKRLSIGDLDFASDKIIAAKMILISEIKEIEGKF